MVINSIVDEKNFTHDYQPIYNIQLGQRIGYEALFRSSYYHNPELAFIDASEYGRVYELDIASIEQAVITFSSEGMLENNQLLFVNALKSTFINPSFPNFIIQLLDKYQFNPSQLVIEITESECLDVKVDTFTGAEQLSEHGVKFALDDLGKGYSSFSLIFHFPFNFIKLDKFFSVDLSKCEKKQSFIQAFNQYCKEQDIKLILEGLEEECDYDTAHQLGLENAQGYYLGRPQAIKCYS